MPLANFPRMGGARSGGAEVEEKSGRWSVGRLRREAASCTACDLYKRATQTVFGEGSHSARMVLVGEQPGHEEDLAGRPFVGPAGRLLDDALLQAGLDRRSVYITNIVKHFKWKSEEGGKRRIHERPRQDEVEACRPWFDKELWAIKPEVVVCLGATAAGAVMGRGTTIRSARGRALVGPEGIRTFVTVHPSAILRMPDRRLRQEEMRRFVGDLRRAARAVASR
jgi:uracil-DNA glycosylase family protein